MRAGLRNRPAAFSFGRKLITFHPEPAALPDRDRTLT